MSDEAQRVPSHNEPRITINGVDLTPAQAMTVRVGLSLADFDCGDDDFGRQLRDRYLQRAQEVFEIMQLSMPKQVSK